MSNGAWSDAKIRVFRDVFQTFLSHVYINSKDTGGHTCLGNNIFLGQQMVLDDICDGLSKDIHDFYILKSRQLGISTFARALTIFWLGFNDGLPGATVFDTDVNRASARREIEAMLDDLPGGFNFPRILTRNRTGLVLGNQSSLMLLSAGVKASQSSGTLGRSMGLALSHCSEICSWNNPEGLEAYRQSLSRINPNRFYLWESTARGFNDWNTIWTEARDDENHSKCTFLGWYTKPSQLIERTDPDFIRYGEQPPTEREIRKIKEVVALYGIEVTQEQLAWIRREMDPGAKADGDAPPEFEGSTLRMQEQPWTEAEAFQQSGASFFQNENLTSITNQFASKKFETWTFQTGLEFVHTRAFRAKNAREVQLKVWDEPQSQSAYVLAVDPAYGRNEANDRSAIQVMRCYADGMDQVAEYAWPLITTKQLAWVIAVIGGWYGSQEGSDVHLIIELNGPGQAVFDELNDLKRELAMGIYARQAAEAGLQDIFRNMRQFLYSRPDAVNPSRSSYHWITNDRRKVQIMERMRDFVSSMMVRLRSLSTIEEMKAITREGDSIEAPGGKKDDRVLALAFAVHCWEDRVRRTMRSQKRTRANEEAKRRMTTTDQVQMFSQHQLSAFLGAKQKARVMARQAAVRRNWRGR